MTKSTYRIKLETQVPYTPIALSMKKKDSARKIIFNLTDGGFPYRVADGTRAVFTARKPDYNVVFNECSVKDGAVVYEVTPQTTAAVGIVECEVRLYGSDAGYITSARFSILVEDTLIDDDMDIESTSEFTALEVLFDEVRELKDSLTNLGIIAKTVVVDTADSESMLATHTASAVETLREEGYAVVFFHNGLYYPCTGSRTDSDGNTYVQFQKYLEKDNAVCSYVIEVDPEGYFTVTSHYPDNWQEMYPDLSVHVDTLLQDVADLKYVPIAFEGITIGLGTNAGNGSTLSVENGRTVDSVTIGWELNKVPQVMVLDGIQQTNEAEGSALLSGLGLTTDTTFTAEATDERDAVVQAKAYLKFLNGVYYGVIADGTNLDSAAVLTLNKSLQSGKTRTFTASAASGERLTYALPSSYGTPTFKIGGFEYAWNKAATIEFTNMYGYTVSYDIWQHAQIVEGSVTVNVS